MSRCAVCNRRVYIPFRCSYCKLVFCDDHRLPEQHNCINLPGKSWDGYKEVQEARTGIWRSPYAGSQKSQWKETVKGRGKDKGERPRARSSRSKNVVVSLIITGIIFVGFYQTQPAFKAEIDEIFTYFQETASEVAEETGKIVIETVENLTPEPPAQEELIQFALNEINKERMKHGLSNVTLSPINCGQSHAQDLLQHGFLSHWGTDGSKPYMRYTLAGGKGGVFENCAWQTTTGFIDPFEAIEKLNWNMVYDDVDSNWGHRDNLLDPRHNQVSIGVAWDEHNLFLVQDFEDFYFLKAEVTQQGSIIELSYTSITDEWSPSQIAVYYDPPPVPLSAEVLSNPPYDNGYGLGEFIGAILPKRYYLEKGLTINAIEWSSNGADFRVRFDISKAYQEGEGVYTLVIWASDNVWTTYSIWH